MEISDHVCGRVYVILVFIFCYSVIAVAANREEETKGKRHLSATVDGTNIPSSQAARVDRRDDEPRDSGIRGTVKSNADNPPIVLTVEYMCDLFPNMLRKNFLLYS